MTPGTTAPARSTTVPRNAPVVADCDHKQEEALMKAAIRRVPTIKNLSRSVGQVSIEYSASLGNW